VIDPNEVLDIQDYDAATLSALIQRLLISTAPEHLIYRECELDEAWRLVDLEIASLRAARGSSAALAHLETVRKIIEQAHDLVGDAADPAAAADCLRELIT